MKLKIEAVSMLPNGKTIKATAGETGGMVLSQHLHGITSEKELERAAKDLLEIKRFDGYQGQFTTFGFPYVDHGYTVELDDNQYRERAGSYFVDEVHVTWGTHGYRREIKLGGQASDSTTASINAKPILTQLPE